MLGTIIYKIALELFYLSVLLPLLNEWYHIVKPQIVDQTEEKQVRIVNFEAFDQEGFSHLFPGGKPTYNKEEQNFVWLQGAAMVIAVIGMVFSEQKFLFLLYAVAGSVSTHLFKKFKWTSPNAVRIDGAICMLLLLLILYNHYAFHFIV
jgi:hypothetical protein